MTLIQQQNKYRILQKNCLKRIEYQSYAILLFDNKIKNKNTKNNRKFNEKYQNKRLEVNIEAQQYSLFFLNNCQIIAMLV